MPWRRKVYFFKKLFFATATSPVTGNSPLCCFPASSNRKRALGEEWDSDPESAKPRLALFCPFIQLSFTWYVDVLVHERPFVIFYFYN